ncbi:MAG: hypothetical protein KKF08_19105 [Gammaproteobacteria bacterium]|nr:hypothetical protein [Gammaproteobacteria bacterium]
MPVLGKHWTISNIALEKLKRRMKGNKNAIGKHKPLSQATKDRMSEAKRGNKCYLWKGGISPINRRERNCSKYRQWQLNVLARDKFTCQKDKTIGGDLCIHHIKNFFKYPELRFITNNGITLSRRAHIEFHKKYGIRNNTLEQVIEFIN